MRMAALSTLPEVPTVLTVVDDLRDREWHAEVFLGEIVPRRSRKQNATGRRRAQLK